MPRFTKTVRGASEQELEKRLDPLFPAMDRGRQVIAEHAARLEQAHLRGAKRELGRIEQKHGRDSGQAKTAAGAMRTAERRLVAIGQEVERMRSGGVKADPQGVVVHGRVLDAGRKAQPNLVVTIIDAAGRATVRTPTDERGYFKLESEPLADAAGGVTPGGPPIATPGPTRPGATAAAGRRPRLVVLDGERELHREDLEKLEAGQARYREIVLPARR